jgi:hypothetical protein
VRTAAARSRRGDRAELGGVGGRDTFALEGSAARLVDVDSHILNDCYPSAARRGGILIVRRGS